MILFHVTTPKKVERYEASGRIILPVRGWSTIEAAREWMRKTGRSIVLRIEGERVHKLPDHRSSFGEAWWIEQDVKQWEAVQ